MKRSTLFLGAIAAVAFSTASATVRNVLGDHSTIQSTINASTHGDTALAQPDT